MAGRTKKFPDDEKYGEPLGEPLRRTIAALTWYTCKTRKQAAIVQGHWLIMTVYVS